jgi:hypothetical protein
MSFYSNDTPGVFNLSGTTICNQLFKINLLLNLIVAAIISILAILLVLKIFLNGKKFFLVKYVPHSAFSSDEDIIIFG